MTQPGSTYTTATRRASQSTRVVALILRVAEACSCGQPPHILVLRGVDSSSREQARVLSDRILAQSTDATIAVRPAALRPAIDPCHDHYCAAVDARRRQTRRALLGYRWEPNQPDTGLLQVALDGATVPVPAGAGVEVRICGEGLGVWVIEDKHQRATRVGHCAGLVEVNQINGLHLTYHDEILLGDSPARAVLAFDVGGIQHVR